MEMLGSKSGSPVSITRDEIGLSERWPECSKAWTYLAVSGSPSSTVITLMTLGSLVISEATQIPGLNLLRAPAAAVRMARGSRGASASASVSSVRTRSPSPRPGIH